MVVVVWCKVAGEESVPAQQPAAHLARHIQGKVCQPNILHYTIWLVCFAVLWIRI